MSVGGSSIQFKRNLNAFTFKGLYWALEGPCGWETSSPPYGPSIFFKKYVYVQGIVHVRTAQYMYPSNCTAQGIFFDNVCFISRKVGDTVNTQKHYIIKRTTDDHIFFILTKKGIPQAVQPIYTWMPATYGILVGGRHMPWGVRVQFSWRPPKPAARTKNLLSLYR